ncbi:MAG: hypothetical protein J5626_01490 [Lachnospiraceae bacterium]|nr:hypothetical protein [Lachnospiraceae bacterium]
METLFTLLAVPILLIAGTILLTLAVEYPIVYKAGITRNKRYIVAVNALTNMCLNMGVVIVFILSVKVSESAALYRVNVWTLFAEAILIPVAETALYLKVSRASAVKVLLITYAANFLSFLVGLFVVGLFTGKDVHGISRFFISIFGGGKFPWNRMYY